MLYYDEVSSNKGEQLAHYDVRQRRELILEGIAVPPLLIGEALATGMSLDDVEKGDAAMAAAGIEANQAVSP